MIKSKILRHKPTYWMVSAVHVCFVILILVAIIVAKPGPAKHIFSDGGSDEE